MITRRDALAGGMALAGLPVIGNASPIKSMLGTRPTEENGSTFQNPYVTDGLVAMWDGEWNAGLGVHNQSITTWKDLSGNEQDCYQNSDIALPLIGSNYLQFDTTRRSFVFDFIEDFKSSKFIGVTLEIRGDFSGKGTNPNFFSAAPLNGYKGDFVSRYAASQLAVCSYSTQVLTNIALPRYGFSITTSSSGFSVFISGSFVNSFNCSFTGNTNLTKGYFGYAVASQMENPRDSKIYCCRIYSRILSADEIAYNYSIDKERFNLS